MYFHTFPSISYHFINLDIYFLPLPFPSLHYFSSSVVTLNSHYVFTLVFHFCIQYRLALLFILKDMYFHTFPSISYHFINLDIYILPTSFPSLHYFSSSVVTLNSHYVFTLVLMSLSLCLSVSVFVSVCLCLCLCLCIDVFVCVLVSVEILYII